MIEHRYRRPIIVLACAVMLAACSTTGSAERRGLQRAAVERWTHCIERYSKAYNGAVVRAGRRANRHCEGYRRDILAVHSPHLQNQIESLLSQRADEITAARLVRTGHSDYQGALNGARLEALKNGLR